MRKIEIIWFWNLILGTLIDGLGSTKTLTTRTSESFSNYYFPIHSCAFVLLSPPSFVRKMDDIRTRLMDRLQKENDDQDMTIADATNSAMPFKTIALTDYISLFSLSLLYRAERKTMTFPQWRWHWNWRDVSFIREGGDLCIDRVLLHL